LIELVQDNELYRRLEEILAAGWFEIPTGKGYGGTGGPGKVLEHLLGLEGGNSDTPDGGKWEIKFHGGKSPLTLFHKDGLPKGHMEKVVAHYGWPDKQKRTSFRHTMWGTSPRGFAMVDIGDALSLTNLGNPIADLPYWPKDILLNALAHKLRRLIVVDGTKSKGRVKYERATLYWEPRTTEFLDAIVNGLIAIDFDARTKSHDRAIDGGKVRNHGTKFRIKASDLPRLYHHHKGFGDG